MDQSEGKYYVPHSTRWPIIGSVGMFLLLGGVSTLLNEGAIGKYAAYAGTALVILMMFLWFREVVGESDPSTSLFHLELHSRSGPGNRNQGDG